MMVKFRDLVNSKILNDEKYVGFYGDSEYVNEDEELIMGQWHFYNIYEYVTKSDIPYTLDSMIDDKRLWDKEMNFIIENDNGVWCMVRFYYDKIDSAERYATINIIESVLVLTNVAIDGELYSDLTKCIISDIENNLQWYDVTKVECDDGTETEKLIKYLEQLKESDYRV